MTDQHPTDEPDDARRAARSAKLRRRIGLGALTVVVSVLVLALSVPWPVVAVFMVAFLVYLALEA